MKRNSRKSYPSGVASSISGGDIFIYSCSAQLISFEINCFYGLQTRIYGYVDPPLIESGYATELSSINKDSLVWISIHSLLTLNQ